MNGSPNNLIDGITRSRVDGNGDPHGEVGVAAGNQDGAGNPAVNSEAVATIDDLSDRIERLAHSIHAPTLLKELFCKILDWRYVNEPMPQSVLPMAARDNISDAIIIAKCEQMPLCYVRLAQSELTATVERKPLDRIARGWPSVLVAFGNFGENELDFCWKALDGRVSRISLDRNLFGAAELAQAIYSMRAFDLRTDEPVPELEVTERLERQLKRLPRRKRERSKLRSNPLFREISRHDLLSHEQEMRLRRQLSPGVRGDERDELILANLRLVIAMADRYRRSGLPWDDLIQEGVIGLIRAADKYDAGRGCRFSTYATWWILQGIRRAIGDDRNLVVTPSHCAGRIHGLRKFWKQFWDDHGFGPSDVDVRDHFNLTDDQLNALRQMRAAWFGTRSIDGVELQEKLPPVEKRIQDRERNTRIRRLLKARLDSRSREIINRRFGFGDVEEETLEQIGQSMSVTRERIRQLERNALEILRHPMQSRQLESYVHP